MKKRILFVCTHNSCRSQMAEGLVNHDFGDRVEAYSAGTEETIVKPRAIAALAEIGIDITHHRSKTLREFEGQTFEWVITLCGSADRECPTFFGGVLRLHMPFDDPSTAVGTEEEIMAEFRRVRSELREELGAFLKKELAGEIK